MPAWTGSKDKGTRTYEEIERVRVIATMRRSVVGAELAMPIDRIAQETGLEARTVRAILSDADGIEFVLAYTDDQKVFVAEWHEEAAGYSMKLEAQVRTMRDRLARRTTLASKLPYRQARLFAE